MNYNYRTSLSKTVLYAVLFAAAMAYVESVVVVLLRQLYFPIGFRFPLRNMPNWVLTMEAVREFATIVMLVLVAVLGARRFWRRFGFFLLLFGVWDICYYVWLKLLIGWPGSWAEPDVLFLIPVPWVGPVIAPMTVAVLMIVIGGFIIRQYHANIEFRPTPFAWVTGIIATVCILYSFMADYQSALDDFQPFGYRYVLLVLGLVLYLIGFIHAYRQATA